jgi:pimeloyl-ACP methyl ester carboxylesterase
MAFANVNGTRLADVRAAALIVTGGRDLPYNTIIGDALCAGIAGSVRLHLPRAGHMANMEEPAAVNEAIARLARAH